MFLPESAQVCGEASDEVTSTTDGQRRPEERVCCAAVRARKKWLAPITHGPGEAGHLVYPRGMLWKRPKY